MSTENYKDHVKKKYFLISVEIVKKLNKKLKILFYFKKLYEL